MKDLINQIDVLIENVNYTYRKRDFNYEMLHNFSNRLQHIKREVKQHFNITENIILIQKVYESEESKTGWESYGWYTKDGQIFNTDKYEISDVIDQDKYGNIIKAVFVKMQ